MILQMLQKKFLKNALCARQKIEMKRAGFLVGLTASILIQKLFKRELANQLSFSFLFPIDRYIIVRPQNCSNNSRSSNSSTECTSDCLQFTTRYHWFFSRIVYSFLHFVSLLSEA